MILKFEQRAVRVEIALDPNLVFSSPRSSFFLFPLELKIKIRCLKLAAVRVKALISRDGKGKLASPHLAVVDPLTTEPAHICVERVRGRVGGRLPPENCAQPFKLIRQRKNHSALAYVNLEPPQILLVQSRIFAVLECNAQGGI